MRVYIYASLYELPYDDADLLFFSRLFVFPFEKNYSQDLCYTENTV